MFSHQTVSTCIIKRVLHKKSNFPSVLKRVSGGMGNAMQGDITPVLDAYTHALLGRFPRTRYLVGKSSGALMLIQSLPEWIGDRILGLQRKGDQPAACKNI